MSNLHPSFPVRLVITATRRMYTTISPSNRCQKHAEHHIACCSIFISTPFHECALNPFWLFADAQFLFKQGGQFTRTETPLPIAIALQSSKMTSLQILNGGVRGIVAGGILRRLFFYYYFIYSFWRPMT